MDRDLVKQVLFEQRNDFLKKNTGVTREKIAEAEEYLQLPHIYLISGIRRCGKSTFLRQIADKFYNNEDFFVVNFEDERLFGFKASDFNTILEIQIELFGNHKTFIIDEIQNIDKFELFLRRLSDSGYKFIVSGSNAELLSGEIATKITGRHIETNLVPFNFREFLSFHHLTVDVNDILDTEKRAIISSLFEEYLYKGGMPEYLTFKTSEIITRMYEDILIKDIAIRNGITNIVSLRDLSRYMVSNFGRRFSYNSLQKATGLGSVNTAKSYCSHLENAFLLRTITKFDHSLKKQFANEKKTYITDNSIIRFVSTQLTNDKGRLLENIVAEHLATDNTLYYFFGKNECDFISINKNKDVSAYQVTFSLDETNKQREIKGLLEAMEFFELNHGTIVTMSQKSEIIDDQKKLIKVIPAWQFFLDQLG
ncbi:MAG: ATP-binding protein [Bacteroidales bacterium]|nr:ATP-binding protein [Bacteroidales bacterium]